jgi:hypothetical protein
MAEPEKPEVNTFQEMEDKKQPTSEPKSTQEISVDNFSDTAVGDKKKYVRPELDGKEDVVDKFQVFMPDTSEDPTTSQSGASKYWPVTMILSYESKNEDEVNNREYISGARVFQSKNGVAQTDINFWYDGGENQSSMIWIQVAEALKIEPKELSPRQFVAYLNNKPKVLIEGKKFKNYNAPVGAPKTVTKNMIGKFI